MGNGISFSFLDGMLGSRGPALGTPRQACQGTPGVVQTFSVQSSEMEWGSDETHRITPRDVRKIMTLSPRGRGSAQCHGFCGPALGPRRYNLPVGTHSPHKCKPRGLARYRQAYEVCRTCPALTLRSERASLAPDRAKSDKKRSKIAFFWPRPVLQRTEGHPASVEGLGLAGSAFACRRRHWFGWMLAHCTFLPTSIQLQKVSRA